MLAQNEKNDVASVARYSAAFNSPTRVALKASADRGKEGEFDTYVRSVLKNSPAYKAGVRPGDIILSIADLQINNSKHFLKTVTDLKPFSNTKLILKRGEETIELGVSIVERPLFKLTSKN